MFQNQAGKELADLLEFDDNPEPRCACVLLLDRSASMSREGRIDDLNRGLAGLRAMMSQDALTASRAEIAIIAYNHDAELVMDFTPAHRFDPPEIQASGNTNAISAIRMGIDLLDRRKEQYRQAEINYYRPMMFLLSDGQIINRQQRNHEQVQAIRNELQDAHDQRRIAFFAIGVGHQADLPSLEFISPTRPRRMGDQAFSAFFQWLSNSMATISHSDPGDTDLIMLPETSDWSL